MRTLLLSLTLSSTMVLAACSSQNNIAVGEPNPTGSSSSMAQTDVSWTFTDVGTEDAPQVKITLNMNGKTIDVGTYAGSASDTTSEQDEAILSASTWWAGGGDDVRVLYDGKGTFIIQHRTTDEESGLGDWEELQTIKN